MLQFSKVTKFSVFEFSDPKCEVARNVSSYNADFNLLCNFVSR